MKRALSLVGTLLCAVVVGAGLAYAVAAHLGYRMLPVLSGSMVPTLPVGTLAVVKPIPADQARDGDVVTFKNPQGDFLTTHRIVSIRRRADGSRLFRTQGDAVPDVDPWTLRAPEGRGRFGLVKLDVPLAGYALVYIQRPQTALYLVWASVILIAALLLRALWRTPAPREVPA